MSEPLPHYVNIHDRLRELGVDGDEPMMFILGGNVVTAEIDARRALAQVASATAPIADENAPLDDFYGDELDRAVHRLAEFHRARRALLTAAAQQGLLKPAEPRT